MNKKDLKITLKAFQKNFSKKGYFNPALIGMGAIIISITILGMI
jgi:hypothetical protein